MKKTTLNGGSKDKDNNEYFIKYELRNEAFGVVVKVEGATEAVKMLEEEYEGSETFKLIDIKNVTKCTCIKNPVDNKSNEI